MVLQLGGWGRNLLCHDSQCTRRDLNVVQLAQGRKSCCYLSKKKVERVAGGF